jgi:hypothetical protein
MADSFPAEAAAGGSMDWTKLKVGRKPREKHTTEGV